MANWDRGLSAALDVSVTSPLNPSLIVEAGTTSGYYLLLNLIIMPINIIWEACVGGAVGPVKDGSDVCPDQSQT